MEFITFLAFVSANKNEFLKTVITLSTVNFLDRLIQPSMFNCAYLPELSTLEYHYVQCIRVQLLVLEFAEGILI